MVKKVEISLKKKNYFFGKKSWNFVEKKKFFLVKKVEISLKKKIILFGQKSWNFVEKKKIFFFG